MPPPQKKERKHNDKPFEISDVNFPICWPLDAGIDYFRIDNQILREISS